MQHERRKEAIFKEAHNLAALSCLLALGLGLIPRLHRGNRAHFLRKGLGEREGVHNARGHVVKG